MSYLNIHEVKARFSHYAKLVMKGQRFIIAFRNRPFAELRPLEVSQPRAISFGVLKGKFELPVDFDEPLKDFEDDFYSS